MAVSSASSEVSDGPVLSLMSKRLRGLRKKYNRILQMEDNLSQGKPLNKEQEEVLRSKPAVVVLIDEYEKLRQPLSLAIQEELSLISHTPSPPPPPPPPPPQQSSVVDDSVVDDLLKLLYFGSLFDVKPQSDFTSTMLTRTHERECCLTYDYVTDEATDLLGERDLDLISMLGGLITARPAHTSLSHKNSLRSCVDHAKLWLSNSHQPIQPGADVTYAELRERLNKILSLDYFTATPEMKAPVDVAAAAEKFAPSHVPVQDLTVQSPSPSVEDEDYFAEQYQDKDEEIANFQGQETVADHTSIEDHPEDDVETWNVVGNDISPKQDQSNTDVEEPNEEGGAEMEQHYVPQRAYQNHRGGGRGGVGRRGYPNGRGGRGGRGGSNYQNGRSQYYDSGNYYPRNYHNMRGRGGGSRSGGATTIYNNHGMGGHDHVGAGVESAQS